MALTVNQSSGSQAPTGQDNLQAGAGGTNTTAQSSRVQPGTPTSALNSGNGVSLNPTPLTTVNLNASTTASIQSPTPVPEHHLNPVLFVLAILVFVAAVSFFWATFRSGKKHNQYT